MKLLVLGSTGLVGRHVLAQAIAHAQVDEVIAPVRRPVEAQPKLLAPVVDFDTLPADAPWWHADAVICALGTTMRIAGSEQAFRRVDHDYPLAAAQLAHAHGTPTYVLNSSTNADRNARVFYLRVKGETENALTRLPFKAAYMIRPGYIQPLHGIRSSTSWTRMASSLRIPSFRACPTRSLPTTGTNAPFTIG